jgi:hypothetical protein
VDTAPRPVSRAFHERRVRDDANHEVIMRTLRTWLRLSAAPCALLLACCSDDVAHPYAPPAPDTLDVQLDTRQLSIEWGYRRSIVVTVIRSGDTGPVTLEAGGVPAGVIATFDPAVLAPGKYLSTLAFEAGETATSGIHAVSVTAAGTGAASKTTWLYLTSLGRLPPSIEIGTLPGDEPIFTVLGDSWAWYGPTVIRHGGFTGAVELSVGALPAGVWVSIQPVSDDGQSIETSLVITAAENAIPAECHVTIRAQGDGVEAVTRMIRFFVAPPA